MLLLNVGSSATIETRLLPGRPEVQFPSKGNDGNFSLRHRVQTWSGAHPTSYPLGTGFLPGVKQPGREAGH